MDLKCKINRANNEDYERRGGRALEGDWIEGEGVAVNELRQEN